MIGKRLGIVTAVLCCSVAVAGSASAEEGQLVKMYGLSIQSATDACK